MLKLESLSIQFDRNVVLNDVNCDFQSGAINTIKKAGMLDGSTTLMKCCAGIMLPASGQVFWKQRPLPEFTDRERFKTLSYCYEWGGLVSLFSVYNNIAIPLAYHKIYPRNEIKDRIGLAAEKLDIESLLELEPFQLNDVQVRLVNLARALVLEAEVILIDEIQSGMPHSMVNSLADLLLEQANKGTTILMVTTSGDDDSFAQRKYVLQDKRLERVS